MKYCTLVLVSMFVVFGCDSNDSSRAPAQCDTEGVGCPRGFECVTQSSGAAVCRLEDGSDSGGTTMPDESVGSPGGAIPSIEAGAPENGGENTDVRDDTSDNVSMGGGEVVPSAGRSGATAAGDDGEPNDTDTGGGLGGSDDLGGSSDTAGLPAVGGQVLGGETTVSGGQESGAGEMSIGGLPVMD